MEREVQRQVRRQPARPLEDLSAPEAPRRTWGRRIARVVVTIALVVLCATVAYSLYIGSIVAKISSNPWSLSGLAADADGRTNVLLLGVGDPGHAGQNLSDSIMIMSLSQRAEAVAQISLPRDLRVNIPGYGTGKINVANAQGGATLAQQVVEQVSGQPMHYTVTTNFSGLKLIVDEVGGLDINVQDELRDTEYPCDDNQYKVCGLDIKPGLQHMDGAHVLAYTRCRKGTCGNDFGRAARQQEVLGLLRAKLVQPGLVFNPTKLTRVVQAVRQSIATDMGAVQLAQLAMRWNNYSTKHAPKHLVLSTDKDGLLVSSNDSSDLLPVGGNFSQIQQRIADIFTP